MRLITGIVMYGLCFCAPPIPFLLMGKPRQHGLAIWKRVVRSRLAAAMLSGLFWFFSLQLLSSGSQSYALLLYLTVATCSVSSVKVKRLLNSEKSDGGASRLFRQALKSENPARW